jgi:hypothetical protein
MGAFRGFTRGNITHKIPFHLLGTLQSFVYVDRLSRNYSDMRPAFTLLDALYEPLWALNMAFKDISPWSLIWKAHKLIQLHTDKAVYTWEKEIIQYSQERRGEENVILWNRR